MDLPGIYQGMNGRNCTRLVYKVRELSIESYRATCIERSITGEKIRRRDNLYFAG